MSVGWTCVGKMFLKHTRWNISSFMCDHCSQTFNTKAHLTAHMKVHSDEIFPCNICDKVFNLKVKLKRHEQRHENLKQFVCNICDKQFAEKRSLKTHTSVVHAGERPFKCTQCVQACYTSSDLTKHSLTHTRGEMWNIFDTVKYSLTQNKSCAGFSFIRQLTHKNMSIKTSSSRAGERCYTLK